MRHSRVVLMHLFASAPSSCISIHVIITVVIRSLLAKLALYFKCKFLPLKGKGCPPFLKKWIITISTKLIAIYSTWHFEKKDIEPPHSPSANGYQQQHTDSAISFTHSPSGWGNCLFCFVLFCFFHCDLTWCNLAYRLLYTATNWRSLKILLFPIWQCALHCGYCMMTMVVRMDEFCITKDSRSNLNCEPTELIILFKQKGGLVVDW